MFDFIETGYISYFLIGINVIITYLAWKKPAIQEALISTGPTIVGKRQWYRTVTSSLLHLDWAHLFWNMFALYNLGPILEEQFLTYFGSYWFVYFGIFYFSTAVLSDLPSIIKHRSDDDYSTLGASGAISAVIAAAVIIDLDLELLVYGIPMPGWLYLVIYLAVSIYLSKRGKQNINHSAHISGAVVAVFAGFLIAHAGLFVSAYPTTNDYLKSTSVSEEVLDLLNSANNGYTWVDNSSKYWTDHNLSYLSTSDGACDVVMYRSEGELLEDTVSFDADSYIGYEQIDGIGKYWFLVNAASEESDCYLATKSVFNWN